LLTLPLRAPSPAFAEAAPRRQASREGELVMIHYHRDSHRSVTDSALKEKKINKFRSKEKGEREKEEGEIQRYGRKQILYQSVMNELIIEKTYLYCSDKSPSPS
jgi:hypothetical protein